MDIDELIEHNHIFFNKKDKCIETDLTVSVHGIDECIARKALFTYPIRANLNLMLNSGTLKSGLRSCFKLQDTTVVSFDDVEIIRPGIKFLKGKSFVINNTTIEDNFSFMPQDYEIDLINLTKVYFESFNHTFKGIPKNVNTFVVKDSQVDTFEWIPEVAYSFVFEDMHESVIRKVLRIFLVKDLHMFRTDHPMLELIQPYVREENGIYDAATALIEAGYEEGTVL